MILVGIPLLVGLYVIGRQHNPLFHSIAEMFSAVVACGIFMLAWNSRFYLDNNSLLVIGVAYLFAGGLLLVHELAYHDLHVYPAYEPNRAAQLWISAKLIQAISLFVAPFYSTRRVDGYRLLYIYMGVTGLALLAIFYRENFPVCYVDGVGSTPFRRVAEYVILTFFLGSIVTFTRHRQYFDTTVFRKLLASIVLTAISELVLSFEARVDDQIFVVGHILMVVSFYFVYDAVIAIGLAKPYDLLVRNLKQSEESLSDTVRELEMARAELESRVVARTAELTAKTQRLQREMSERERAEEALRASETKYRIVADNTRDWEWWMAPDGHFLYTSPSCRQITGFDAREFIDDKDLIFRITHPDDRERLIDHVREVDQSHRGGEVEFRIIRSDGAERYLAHACAPVFDGEGRFLGHRGSNRDITERKNAENALRESEETLRQLSARLLTVQETERKRVARELHDGINQNLSAIKFGLETKLASMDSSRAPDGVSLERIISLVRAGIEEARRIQMDLRPPMLDDLGIVATLQWFTREFHAVYTHIDVEVEADVEESDVPDAAKVALFRIVQEAMNNISRHSRADSVRLSLKRNRDQIELLIEDNGVGFDMENIRRGIGISSMKERAEVSLGAFSIHSAPDQGTSIAVTWSVGS